MYRPETKTILISTDPVTGTEYSFVLDLTRDGGATIIIKDLPSGTSKAKYYPEVEDAYADWERITKSIILGYGTPDSHVAFLKRDR